MTQVAVDIALLPPEDIMDLCLKINASKECQPYMRLGRTDYIPHITLLMGVLKEKDLKKAKSQLEEISRRFSTLNLEISGLSHINEPGVGKSYSFDITKTEHLMQLHSAIMKNMLPLLTYKVSPDMFYSDPAENIRSMDTGWVRDFLDRSAGANYFPHITLKCRNAKYDDFPIQFTAPNLAMYQLGNHCTCRKILFSTKLKG